MNYEEGITVGEMLTRAQYDYIDNIGKDCFTLGEFVLYGDPSLKVGGYGESEQGIQQSNFQINPLSQTQQGSLQGGTSYQSAVGSTVTSFFE